MTQVEAMRLKEPAYIPRQGDCALGCHWQPSCDHEENDLVDEVSKQQRRQIERPWDLDDIFELILALSFLLFTCLCQLKSWFPNSNTLFFFLFFFFLYASILLAFLLHSVVILSVIRGKAVYILTS